MAYTMHTCDVCLLADNDATQKECRFCHGCQAWICIECEGKPVRRAEAMLKKARLRATEIWRQRLARGAQ